MRLLLVSAVALVLVPAASAWPNASLKVTVWPNGKKGASHTWTLRCTYPGPRGTHPSPQAACLALSRHPKALKPVPQGIGCTQQWDGPQVALVRGTFRGKRIRATFKRTNGCEIGRWDALRALLPVD
jgi:Subtilisin inhibitor-like